jgi:hypothetical protein
MWQPKCRRFPSITIAIQLNYGLNPNLKPVVYGSLKILYRNLFINILIRGTKESAIGPRLVVDR